MTSGLEKPHLRDLVGARAYRRWKVNRNAGTETSFIIPFGGGACEGYKCSVSPTECCTVLVDLPAPIPASISGPVDAYLDLPRSGNSYKFIPVVTISVVKTE